LHPAAHRNGPTLICVFLVLSDLPAS